MEQGSLESEGVSGRVLEALGSIVGASAESLRHAGESLTGGMTVEDQADPAFTRMQHPSAYADGQAVEADDRRQRDRPSASEEWDEVDELFRGGS